MIWVTLPAASIRSWLIALPCWISGEAVGALASFHKIAAGRILVAVDDAALMPQMGQILRQYRKR